MKPTTLTLEFRHLFRVVSWIVFDFSQPAWTALPCQSFPTLNRLIHCDMRLLLASSLLPLRPASRLPPRLVSPVSPLLLPVRHIKFAKIVF